MQAEPVDGQVPMPYFYQSGEDIRVGDRVTYGGESAEVEFIADPSTDPTNWYVTEHGGGVMVSAFGHVFLHDTEDEEDLILVGRQGE